MTMTSVLSAQPQFSEAVVVGSSTRQLYEWLEEQGFLWMLEEPHDQPLAVFAGSAPVARMWHWSHRAIARAGGETPTAPETAAEIESALVLVEQMIKHRFS